MKTAAFAALAAALVLAAPAAAMWDWDKLLPARPWLAPHAASASALVASSKAKTPCAKSAAAATADDDLPDKNVNFDKWSAKGAYVVRKRGRGAAVFAYRTTVDATKKRARTDVVQLPLVDGTDAGGVEEAMQAAMGSDTRALAAARGGQEYILFAYENEGYIIVPGRRRGRGPYDDEGGAGEASEDSDDDDEVDARGGKALVSCYKFPMQFRKMDLLKGAVYKDLSFHDGHLTHHYVNVTGGDDDEDDGKGKYEVADAELFLDAFDKSIREFFMVIKRTGKDGADDDADAARSGGHGRRRGGHGRGRGRGRGRGASTIVVDVRNKYFTFSAIDKAFDVPDTVKAVCKQGGNVTDEVQDMLLPASALFHQARHA